MGGGINYEHDPFLQTTSNNSASCLHGIVGHRLHQHKGRTSESETSPHPARYRLCEDHTTFDGDYVWCTYAEIDLQFDSLRVLREKLQESKECQQLAPMFNEEWELFQRYQDACINAFYVS